MNATNDEHQRTLINNVFPADWTSPSSTGRYNLVVIGGGTAGLVTAAAGAILGARVALIESRFLGGDCLNTGCVPSKALLRSARTAANARSGETFGVSADEVHVNFPAVMERMRRLRAKISHNDSATRFRDLGVELFFGKARFTSRDTIQVGDDTLRFVRAVVATGARATLPPIPGLAETSFLTNENVFDLTELPQRLLVIGGGPIGCELAQAFARFGSQVTLVEMQSRFLGNEDPDAAALLQEALVRDGIQIRLSTTVRRIETRDGVKRVTLEQNGTEEALEVDQLLVGVGRSPNVEGLGLEDVGVEFNTRTGVRIDDNLRTSNRRIFAVGDVAMRHKFTHTADAAARIVVQNALFFGRKKLSGLVVPWCTYTAPEIAHVGLYERELDKRGQLYDTVKIDFADVDRAILDGDDNGFVKIHIARNGGKILGATIVADHAGDLISELTLAMTQDIPLRSISSVIHPYPTQAEAIKKAADALNRGRLTPRLKSMLSRWFAWRR